MKPTEAWLLIFAVQGLAICVDEFYFHLKRGLPLWERIGHPIDTLSVLAPMCLVLFTSPGPSQVSIFVGLALFSCVLITKDEFVHKDLCSAAENWLHAILFVVHPLALLLAGLIWISPNERLHQALTLQVIVIGCFLLYQIVYWSFIWKKSITTFTTASATDGTPPKMTRSRF